MRVLFSIVPTVGDPFWTFGTTNKGLAWQQIAIKQGTNMAVLAWSWNICAIFSSISDFAVYVHTTVWLEILVGIKFGGSVRDHHTYICT